jgi:hypothetical protein
VSVLAAAPADAACKKFAFLVNDYGKEGPTNDAKKLLDKNISEWAAQNGITSYQTGKKTVTCELFLDVILFDEHTCTAQANVCWGAGVKPNNNGEQAEVTGETSGEAPPHPVRKSDAMGVAPQQAAAVTPAAEATAAPAIDAAPTEPVEQIAAPAETPAATPAVHTTGAAEMQPIATPPATSTVETGALQAGQGLPPAGMRAATSNQDRAAAATAAATAAAAAERAAVAAETAASAAKEAAAAAVAASAASRGPATVPPLDHASGATPAHNE